MSEFYKRTYNLNQLEFDVVSRGENVIITCLDKELHKSYQDTFTNEIVSNSFSINNLKNFIEIIDWSFAHNSISVVAKSRKLNIEINYSNVLEFNFNFTLEQNEHTQLNANSIYIKKLEERIEQLDEHIKRLEEHIEQLEENQFVLIGNVQLSSGGYENPIPIPMRINEIIINTNFGYGESGNSFYYHSIIFNEQNLTLNMSTKSCGIIVLSGFLKLKPKKITFQGNNVGLCNKSLFPREYP